LHHDGCFVQSADADRDSLVDAHGSRHVNEEAFRLLVEQIADFAMFVLEPSGLVATWNAGAQRIEGYTAAEIVGQHISKLYRPADARECEIDLERAARDGRSEGEAWLVRKDGSPLRASIAVTALRNAAGRLLGFAVLARALSDGRTANEGPVESEARFRLLVESVKDYAIFMLDQRGVISTWNVGAERIKGYRAEEIVGQHFSRFYPEDQVLSGVPERELEDAARDGRFEDEGWRIRKDGSRFWANVVITALRDARGELVGFAKVTRDLTERRRTEQERVSIAEREAARESTERSVELLTRLHALAGSLAAARTAEEIAELVVKEGTEALRAASGVFVQPNEDELEIVATHRIDARVVETWRKFSPEVPSPITAAYKSAKAQWIETPEELARSYPELPSVPVAASAAALPLIGGENVLGVLGFRFDGPRHFSSEERALVQAMAAQAAQAIVRAHAYAGEIVARERVETLAELSAAFSRALSTDDVAQIVVERGMQVARADVCTLYVLDEPSGSLELIAERGCTPAIAERVRHIAADSGNPVYGTLATGEFMWVETEREYAELLPALATMKAEGPRARAFWSAPLVAEGHSIGLIGMGFYTPRRFSAEERAFVTAFTRQCAEALLRARRYTAERTARRLADNLQASLSTTLRSIGDAVIATDPSGIITLMNGVAESLTGFREAEARGRPLTEVFRIANEHTREIAANPVEKVLERGTVVGLANHTVLIARDGRHIPIDDSGAPIRRGDGPIEGVVLVFRDVTEKKREESLSAFLTDATTTLAESLDYEATLSKVARLAVPALADWCAVDIVVEGERSPKRLAVAHIDPAKVQLAREIQAKYPPDPDAPTGVSNVLRTGRAELYPYIPDELLAARCVDEEHLRIARELKLRSAMAVPLVARDRVFGVVTFVFAETDRVYTQEDLRFAEEVARRCAIAIENARLYSSEQRAREAADVANRAKDEFLAVVSHELRTPLNAIMGWAKLMSSPKFDNRRLARAVETIDRNAVAMAQLIEDLLDMSRIISGKMRLDVQQVDLGGVIDAAIESIKPAADVKSIVIECTTDAAALPVVGDPARLQQIVWNLLSNAVKFTSGAGRVDVRLHRDAEFMQVSVTDTGKGIAPGFVPYVFDAFRQEHAHHTRSHGGLGLGLAITRQLVELHGGRIEAQSEGEGRGATFTTSLPIAAVTSVGQRPRRSVRQFRPDSAFERPVQLRGLRVLVVDDEEDARQLVKTILEDCGCIVVLADSVGAAMAAFAQELPDVVVSDIGMPERDGYDLIRYIRALPPERGGDVPATALTAYVRPEDRRRMLNAGYSMHVPKPVEPAELVAVVASLTRFMHRIRTPRPPPG
jgi:PAS domain S-box-containing protein